MIGCFETLRLMMAFVLTLLHLDWHMAPRGYLMVEGFFAISGFFIARKNHMRGPTPLKKLVIGKLAKLYPPYFLSLMFIIALLGIGYFGTNLPYVLSLTYGLWYRSDLAGIGFRPYWFVSIYFWVYIAVSYLTGRVNKKFYLMPMFALSVAIAISIRILSPSHGVNVVAEYSVWGFSIGLLRGIMGISFGVLAYEAYRMIEPRLSALPNTVFSVVEIMAMGAMAYIVAFSGYQPAADFIALAVWPLIIVCLYARRGWISRFMDRIGTEYPHLAALSYPLFLIHFPIADDPALRPYFTDHIICYEMVVFTAAILLQVTAEVIRRITAELFKAQPRINIK